MLFRKVPIVQISIFIALTASILLFGNGYYQLIRKRLIHKEEINLNAIAELKISQIQEWRNERMRDATYIFANENRLNQIREYLKNPNDKEKAVDLTGWMQLFKNYF